MNEFTLEWRFRWDYFLYWRRFWHLLNACFPVLVEHLRWWRIKASGHGLWVSLLLTSQTVSWWTNWRPTPSPRWLRCHDQVQLLSMLTTTEVKICFKFICVLFALGLGWHWCRGVPQFAVHPRKERIHAPGRSFSGTGGRLQTQGQCHIAF